MDPIIGVDFDNTMISYDELMYRISVEWGLIPEQFHANKKKIRDHIRTIKDGELKWQKLQAVVYGSRINEAVIFDGVKEFFDTCLNRKISIYVVSHKTIHPAQDKCVNLHQAALDWLSNNSFLSTGYSCDLSRKAVFFEATRKEKIKRIKGLGCTHFIDDLIETFSDPTFPTGTSKMLFSPMEPDRSYSNAKVLSSWDEIYNEFF